VEVDRHLKHWTDTQRWIIAAETGFACAYCQIIFGSVVSRPGHEPRVLRMQVDHFIPVSWTGREGDRANCVAACQICNALKQDAIFDSVVNARRQLDRLWVKGGYRVEFIPARSNFEDPDGWARDYARYLRTVGVRMDAE